MNICSVTFRANRYLDKATDMPDRFWASSRDSV